MGVPVTRDGSEGLSPVEPPSVTIVVPTLPRPKSIQRRVAVPRALAHQPLVLAGGRPNGLQSNLTAEASQVPVDDLNPASSDARGLQPFCTSNDFFADSAEAYGDVGAFHETLRFNAGEDRDFGERRARPVDPLRFVPEASERRWLPDPESSRMAGSAPAGGDDDFGSEFR